MTIDIYDENPHVLKKKLARFYNVKIKKDQRLMIPGRDDVIFVNVYYERDKHASLFGILNDIARYYWKDRIKFKYEELSEELIADRWKALNKAREKVRNKKMGAYELYQEGILTENEYEMEHYAEIHEVLNCSCENESEEMNDELAEVVEYEEDGEEIWLVQNHTTGKMSTGFTKRDAIHNYNEGKVFDISEWEEYENE